jgi:hypothetical protein
MAFSVAFGFAFAHKKSKDDSDTRR